MSKHRWEVTIPWLHWTGLVLKCVGSFPRGRVLNSLCRVPPQRFWDKRSGMQPQMLRFKSSHTPLVSWLLIHPHVPAVGPEKVTSLLSVLFPCLGNGDEESCTSQCPGRTEERRAWHGHFQSFQCLSSAPSCWLQFLCLTILIGCSFSRSFDSSLKHWEQNDRGQGRPPSLQSGVLDKLLATCTRDDQALLLGWFYTTTPLRVLKTSNWKTEKWPLAVGGCFWGVHKTVYARRHSAPTHSPVQCRPSWEDINSRPQQCKSRKACWGPYVACLLWLQPWKNQSQFQEGLVTMENRSARPRIGEDASPARRPHLHCSFPFSAPRTGGGNSFNLQ